MFQFVWMRWMCSHWIPKVVNRCSDNASTNRGTNRANHLHVWSLLLRCFGAGRDRSETSTSAERTSNDMPSKANASEVTSQSRICWAAVVALLCSALSSAEPVLCLECSSLFRLITGTLRTSMRSTARKRHHNCIRHKRWDITHRQQKQG